MMKKIISASAASARTISEAEIATLHETCAEIEAQGGELGAVASEIRRISNRLAQLAQYIDRVLETAHSEAVREVDGGARRIARLQSLKLLIRDGEESGAPLDGPTAMDDLLAEAANHHRIP